MLAAGCVASLARAADPVPTGPGLEPWSDTDPRATASPPTRRLRLPRRRRVPRAGRLRHPIPSTRETARDASWIEHRLRLDATRRLQGQDPHRLLGRRARRRALGRQRHVRRRPELERRHQRRRARTRTTRPVHRPTRGGDPLNAESYGCTLCPPNAVHGAQALRRGRCLPFGLLRVGRQPVLIGTGVQAADGDGRPNRFGVSRHRQHTSIASSSRRSRSRRSSRSASATRTERGAHHRASRTTASSRQPAGARRAVNQLDARAPLPRADARARCATSSRSAYHAYRWDEQYVDAASTASASARTSRFGDFRVGFDARDRTSARRARSRRPTSSSRTIRSSISRSPGRRARRGSLRPTKLWALYLEGDYASGSDDPAGRARRSPSSRGRRGHQRRACSSSSRSSPSRPRAPRPRACELLRRLGATTLPRRRRSPPAAPSPNAIALFPQLDVRPVHGRPAARRRPGRVGAVAAHRSDRVAPKRATA